MSVNSLSVLRHAETPYNIFAAQKAAEPLYVAFKQAHNRRLKDPETAKRLAQELLADERFVFEWSDANTPITEEGARQAKATGVQLPSRVPLPSVVLLSPYIRTKQTRAGLVEGWPELGDVPVVEDERLREQEFGMGNLYNDWRIFQCLHPEQAELQQRQGLYRYRYSQGENIPDVRQRAHDSMRDVNHDYAGENVMIVGHHRWILAFMANQGGLDEATYMQMDRHDRPINCGLTTYQGQTGKLTLDLYNQQLY